MTTKKNEVATTQEVQQPALNLGGLDKFRAGKGEEITGLEAVDRSDIKLPKIKLIQSTSAEAQKGKCPAGHYYNTVTNETYPELKAYLLVLGKSRVMWKKPFKRGEEPLCRSFDGLHKFDGTKLCSSCKYQDWNNLADGENKPACNMGYVWLGVTADAKKTPFRLIASGSSVSPTKDFLNTILPNKLPPFVYEVTLGSEQRENESGIFYVMTYKIDGVITEEMYQPLDDLANGMRDMFFQAIKTEIENAVVGDDDIEGSTEGNGGLF